MANIKLAFLGTKESETEETELTVFINDLNQITVRIEDTNCSHQFNYQGISLDKSTAIKLHRELKKQISFIEEGGSNG